MGDTQNRLLSYPFVFSAVALALNACQLRFEDQMSNPKAGTRGELTTLQERSLRPIQPNEHPFSPQHLGPSFTIEPVPDSKENWTYRFSYLGQLLASRLIVGWDDLKMEIHPAQRLELTFDCQGKHQHKLTLQWSSVNDGQDKVKSFEVVCPQNFDLRRAEDEKRFIDWIEQATDQSSLVIGYLTLAAKNYPFKLRQKHLSLWIYQLRSNLDEKSPEWRFSLVPEAFPPLVTALKDLHLHSEWQRLEKEYPYFHQMLPELKMRYKGSFNANSGTLHELIPEVYVYIHNQRGHLKIISQSSPGPAPISGADLAPDFYKNVVSPPAARGSDGATGEFKIEERSDVALCPGGIQDGIKTCEITKQYCKVTQQGSPGLPGQPGTIPGIPGLNGFPALPGPQIFVDSGQLVADSKMEVTFLPAEVASKGGVGSLGQPGGAGGKGGAQTCKFEGNKLVPDKRHSDGANGANAPAGSNGNEGSVITCTPTSVYVADKILPSKQGSSSEVCNAYRKVLAHAHYVGLAKKLKTGSWILPQEKASQEHDNSYLAWRRGLWLSSDFFKDSTGENPFFLPPEFSPSERTAIQQHEEHTGTKIFGPKQEL